MDADGLPIVGAGVDYSKVGPIQTKRTLAFINHFVSSTVQFLNRFSSSCEIKLEDLNARIQRIETSLSILEAKLSSIPGLDDVSVNNSARIEPPGHNQAPSTVLPVSTASHLEQPQTEIKDEAPHIQQNGVQPQTEEVPQEVQETNTVSKDPRYAKYFKMIHVGVPIGALRLKMEAEGLDPSYLDTPDAAAPPTTTELSSGTNQSEDESDSGSSFSDE